MTHVTPRLSMVRGVVLSAFLVLLVGCAPGDLPLSPAAPGSQDAALAGASDVTYVTPARSATVSFALSPVGLAKRASRDDAKTVTQYVRARWGGVLSIRKRSTVARLTVPPGSLDENTTITMSVSGQGLDTVIEFGPSGTTFTPPAELLLTFQARGVDPSAIVSTLSDGGKSEPVAQKVTVRGNKVVILASIPHFSIYDPDLIDGEVQPPG